MAQNWNYTIINLTNKTVVSLGQVLKATIDVDYITNRLSAFTIDKQSNEKLDKRYIYAIRISNDSAQTIFRGKIIDYLLDNESNVIEVKAQSLFSLLDIPIVSYIRGDVFTNEFWEVGDFQSVIDNISETSIANALSSYYRDYDSKLAASVEIKQNNPQLLNQELSYKRNDKVMNLLVVAMFKSKLSLKNIIKDKGVEFQFKKLEPIKVNPNLVSNFKVIESSNNFNQINQVVVKSGLRFTNTSGKETGSWRGEGTYRYTLLKDGTIIKDVLSSISAPHWSTKSENNTSDKLANIEDKNRIFPVVRKNETIFTEIGDSWDTPGSYAYKKALSILSKTIDALYISFDLDTNLNVDGTKSIGQRLLESIGLNDYILKPIIINYKGTTYNSVISGYKYEMSSNVIHIKVGAQRIDLTDKLNKIIKGAIL